MLKILWNYENDLLSSRCACGDAIENCFIEDDF